MTASIILYELYEVTQMRTKPDPNGPHSSSPDAPRTVSVNMRKGWCTLRGGDGVLRAVITTNHRRMRLMDVVLPDTVINGLIGRHVRDVIDHPGIDGDLEIIRAWRGAVGTGKDHADAFVHHPWFGIETRRAMLDPDGDHVQRIRKGTAVWL